MNKRTLEDVEINVKTLKERDFTSEDRFGVHEPSLVIEEHEDFIKINGKVLEKPFVEKPSDSENHYIYIYYKGGGVRKLFRKINNISSEMDYTIKGIRKVGSFIYEEFIPSTTDIKVYAMDDRIYAESRKSPSVDGIVERDSKGKEKREVIKLTELECSYGKTITKAFKQLICGFDVIRYQDTSYVIDVNGWSFVKGNEMYYEMCFKVLDRKFKEVSERKDEEMMKDNTTTFNYEPSSCNDPNLFLYSHYCNSISTSPYSTSSREIPKLIVKIYRHGDRTPKQKLKVKMREISEREEEIIVKNDFEGVLKELRNRYNEAKMGYKVKGI
ncbi:inositol hexakisphosphate and diphosphoinositol-pentakisphosphate kinase-like [Nylanderia fulva]|uniref:inositol hexakisphosphate and diphosphoinositol-pentakisphosphate kinase-like n=1 Tax=Nylanderia fulva TaxID=613905 RepID=UPI0010FBA387|nr:inositol hexakisphosphate and diphosphoinositol-pentakisphosphate kinase-like [Nylanderia fulva]